MELCVSKINEVLRIEQFFNIKKWYSQFLLRISLSIDCIWVKFYLAFFL